MDFGRKYLLDTHSMLAKCVCVPLYVNVSGGSNPVTVSQSWTVDYHLSTISLPTN